MMTSASIVSATSTKFANEKMLQIKPLKLEKTGIMPSEIIFPSHLIKHQCAINLSNNKDLNAIKEFKKRALELHETLRGHVAFPIARIPHQEDIKISEFQANTPEKRDISDLALKFRFFFLQNEPTQFERVLNILYSNTSDDITKSYLKHLRLVYKEQMKCAALSEYFSTKITNREVIDYWMNAEYFHSELEKRKKLQIIHKSNGESSSLHQFYTALRTCSSNVLILYYVVHKFESSHQYIYSPNHLFTNNGSEQDQFKHSDTR